MRDAWLDLVLGSSCAVCGLPGRLLCEQCRHALPRRGYVAWPTPCPPGLALPMAAGEYDGALKVLVNAHKERRQFALAGPLGDVLAGVVRDLTGGAPGQPRPWVMVPVPSRGAVVRERGHDPMLRITRSAAASLRRSGVRVAVARLVESRGVTRDQAGLDADQRLGNLAGSMRCRSRLGLRYRRRWPRLGLVVVDDVITTGSTSREAQRALEDEGLTVCGIAAVAATRKRLAVRTGPPDER